MTERKKKRNDRVVAVPEHSLFAGDLPEVRNLPATATEQLEKFFDTTNALKSKKLEFLGWCGPGRAIKLINRCRL
ncbi:inorganic diphosphatase [Bradyrhizobium sp. Gha]|uniref:inorganic diphosphatase n=1 Tax=Bradyrhizobium sp. Gha TaxID=1855318 RepID=UPI001FCD8C44|nr:inorganic diphosphatase [Bradyrhizobium sp. Gha]